LRTMPILESDEFSVIFTHRVVELSARTDRLWAEISTPFRCRNSVLKVPGNFS
jgi:hypothetical protein